MEGKIKNKRKKAIEKEKKKMEGGKSQHKT